VAEEEPSWCIGRRAATTLNFPIEPRTYELLSASPGGVCGSAWISSIMPFAAASSTDRAQIHPTVYSSFANEVRAPVVIASVWPKYCFRYWVLIKSLMKMLRTPRDSREFSRQRTRGRKAFHVTQS